MERLRGNPNDPDLFGAAVHFLRVSDPEAVEEISRPALRTLRQAAPAMGGAWAMAALGVTARDLETGSVIAAGPELPTTGFAGVARAQLSVDIDARVVEAALRSVDNAVKSLAVAGNLPTGFQEFCLSLVDRGRELRPDSGPDAAETATRTCEPSATPAAATNVEPAQLRKKRSPTYPERARQLGVQRTVRLAAKIDKDGKIEELALIEGPLWLYDSSREAVLQWDDPATLSDEAVEVSTEIEVNFQLN